MKALNPFTTPNQSQVKAQEQISTNYPDQGVDYSGYAKQPLTDKSFILKKQEKYFASLNHQQGTTATQVLAVVPSNKVFYLTSVTYCWVAIAGGSNGTIGDSNNFFVFRFQDTGSIHIDFGHNPVLIEGALNFTLSSALLAGEFCLIVVNGFLEDR